jgi:CDP-2,3-bis-(O-geranylgeranyl)-sn-glycerol synthase
MSALALLFLLFVANGTPVILRILMKEKFNMPVDGNLTFMDSRPLLGTAKTIRGIIGSVVLTTLAAPLMGFTVQTGAVVGSLAMAGDIVSSFVKRRLGIAPSDRALGIDQIPESLFPALAVRSQLNLGWTEVVLIVAGFMAIGLVMSRILFKAGIRRRPY